MNEKIGALGDRLQGLLKAMAEKNISDIHFKAGSSPILRVDGDMTFARMEPLTADQIESMVEPLLAPEQKRRYQQEGELDLSFAVEGLSRFRIHLYRQKGTPALTLRVIPLAVRSFEDLGLPADILRKLCEQSRGLVLIAGMTGSGKTTTLNAMLDHINSHFAYNIITIEDPIEYLHTDKKSSLSQREIGSDTRSFAAALRHVLRQDPDVVVIGEMRGPEEMAAGLTAAETGHLVLSTIHTLDAVQTIDRIVDVFPEYQQKQVRQQLANVLKGIVAQRLVMRKDEKGRIPAVETLLATSLIRKLILEGKTSEIYKAMESGAYYGMKSFDQALLELLQEGRISYEEALDAATHPDDFAVRAKGLATLAPG